MIRTLRGKVVSKNPPRAVMEVGGVGYGIFMSLDSFDRIKAEEEVFIYIYNHIAEDKLDLYGFLESEQRDFFELLISVSGVGPKMALSILNSNHVNILRSAIAEENPQLLSNASGVGRKIAERIIIDLKTKIGIQPDLASGYGDTYEALRALGYTAGEVKGALSALPADVTDTQEQIKLALRALARK